MNRISIVLATVLGFALSLLAASGNGPAITNPQIDYSTNRITIAGSSFSPQAAVPTVNLNGSNLTLISFTDTQIVANVSASLTPGTYLGTNIWIANQTSRTLTNLRASDGAVLGTFAVGGDPTGVAFDGANIWVANQSSNSVTKLRASDGAVLRTFAVGGSPFGVAFDPGQVWVYKVN